ncbi:MAG: helix-turn-helix transcriptional regulator [Planctomycetaceae bacterium]|nr:helix-turn-helix transcriptional regulator [Planctomycetaceae bacterium]
MLAAGVVPETRSPAVATNPRLIPQRGLRSGSSRLQRVGEELQSQARNAAASDMVGSMDQLLETLSLREWDVLILMLKGCTCKEIGSELHIGLPTVAKHRARVLKKFGVRDHIELFQMLNNIVGRNLPRPVGLAAGGMQAIHRIDAADASPSDSGAESPEAKIHRRIEPNDLVRKQVTHRE